MLRRCFAVVPAVLSVLSVAALVPAQCPGPGVFASAIVSYSPGIAVNPSFSDPNRLLCAPGGFADVIMLGIQGSVTAQLGTAAVDGPGTDFIVYENGFFFGGLVYGELAFVEVSTNGVDFARFPGRYYGPQAAMGPFDGFQPGSVSNIAGLGLLLSPSSPAHYSDPVRGGGDAFDLADLAGHPLVVAGTVNLGQIHHVRLVDILGSGATTDSVGVPIYDPTDGASSSDWDAIAVAHTAANQDPGRPAVDVHFDSVSRVLSMTVVDADGILDLDFGSLAFAVNEDLVDLGLLLPFFPVQIVTPTSITLGTAPIAAGFKAKVALSMSDLAGRPGGDVAVIAP